LLVNQTIQASQKDKKNEETEEINDIGNKFDRKVKVFLQDCKLDMEKFYEKIDRKCLDYQDQCNEVEKVMDEFERRVDSICLERINAMKLYDYTRENKNAHARSQHVINCLSDGIDQFQKRIKVLEDDKFESCNSSEVDLKEEKIEQLEKKIEELESKMEEIKNNTWRNLFDKSPDMLKLKNRVEEMEVRMKIKEWKEMKTGSENTNNSKDG